MKKTNLLISLVAVITLFIGAPSAFAGFIEFSNAVEALGPVAYYHLDGNADDATTNNIDGTIYGATLGADGPWSSLGVSADGDTAMSFDGVNDYVDLGNSSSLQPSGAYTISAWVYREGDGIGVFNGIVTTCKKTGTLDRGQYGYSLLYDPAANIVKSYIDEDGAGDWKKADSDGDLSLNTWYYLTGVWDGSTVTLYVDGIAQTITGSANKITYHAGTESAIGQYWWNPGEGYFDGIIDEPAIFNKALTTSEIQGLYGAGTAVIPEPATLSLLGFGLLGLLGFRKKRS